MNLIPCKGVGRRCYTMLEVCTFLGMTKHQVHRAVRMKRLKRRGNFQFPYLQADVNEFLNRINAGE